mmetsp:Transcript_29054/g.81886  ORF Transcript_29054/g.81886 Transcript_29054/m.81886 type:complete len:85 (-) Transcript_29054:55-309(-)
MPKVEFLCEEVGCTTKDLSRHLPKLMFSLEGRIRPRFELLKSTGLPFKLGYITLSDVKFEELVESMLGEESPERDFLLLAERLQ